MRSRHPARPRRPQYGGHRPTFGLTSLQVKRTLAIGNLLPRIRNLYRNEKIDAVTMRHLTLASKAQQREWLALVDCPEKPTPTCTSLRAWLFGGSADAAKVALFDLDAYIGDRSEAH